MNKRKYITTTLPYANSPAHIGHAFEFIIADALVRHFKYSGHDVFFNIGLDEHGLKIQQAAELDGITPQEYVDELFNSWKEFVDIFDINSYDNFYRTSSSEHGLKVQLFWKEALERGDIYKKKYKGTYCVGCESYKNDRDLIDGKCSDHPTTELQEVEEENYFFRLSKYREELIKWEEDNDDFIEPKSKRNELFNFLDGLKDISISREKDTVSWGVPVPGDEDQTIYVWFDALLNYIFAAGYISENEPDNPVFEELWDYSDVVQICGPDNLKFQAVIFQGLLASAGIKKSDKLLVHGTILDAQGRKMSKTLGNVVDPLDQVQKYGIEAVRYYALAGITTYGNSKWDEERLVELYNSHLADDYGNLVSRVTHLAGKVLEEYEDDSIVKLDYTHIQNGEWCTAFDEKIKTIVKPLWESYKVSEALHETNQLVKSLNLRINDEKPWEDLRAGWVTILELHYAINKINDLYYPVVPGKVGQIRKSLKECVKTIAFPKIITTKKQTT